MDSVKHFPVWGWERAVKHQAPASRQTTGVYQMTHSQFASGEVKVGEDQMEKVHLAAQQEQRAGAQECEMCLSWQAGSGWVPYCRTNLHGPLAPKPGRQLEQCRQVSMLGVTCSTQTACSHKPSFVCHLLLEWAVFYHAPLSQQGHKCDNATKKARMCWARETLGDVNEDQADVNLFWN